MLLLQFQKASLKPQGKGEVLTKRSLSKKMCFGKKNGTLISILLDSALSRA